MAERCRRRHSDIFFFFVAISGPVLSVPKSTEQRNRVAGAFSRVGKKSHHEADQYGCITSRGCRIWNFVSTEKKGGRPSTMEFFFFCGRIDLVQVKTFLGFWSYKKKGGDELWRRRNRISRKIQQNHIYYWFIATSFLQKKKKGKRCLKQFKCSSSNGLKKCVRCTPQWRKTRTLWFANSLR